LIGQHNEWTAIIWWCRYLQTVPVEAWSSDMQTDFATLPGSDAAKWAEANRHLWSGRKGPLMPRPGSSVRAPTHLALVIDVEAADDDIAKRVQFYVDQLREELGIVRAAGRPKWNQRQGKWKLARRPNNEYLSLCFDAWTLNGATDKPMWQKMKLLAKNHPVAKNALLDDDRKQLQLVFSRYLKAAEKLRTGVAEGVFP